MKKRIPALLLALVLFAACLCPASAAEEPAQSGTLKVVNYNVDGLPIPAFMTHENRDPLACSKKIPAVLNACEADIIAVQEDFNYHYIHKKGIDLPYKTLHAGGIPFGDGLNFFSRYPLYNVVREEWNEAYGILDSSSDALTPKGFLCASMQIGEGVYIDVYNLHADADDGDGDIAARVSQFQQLLAFVDRYSRGHAVLIVGDTNARFLQTASKLEELFVTGAGFKEVWIELENEGRYTLTPEDEARFNSRYSSWWGVWDSAEKIFYRDGGGVSFEALTHEYVWYMDDEGNRLADHACEIAELRYTIDRSAVADSRTYKKEFPNPLRWIWLHTKYFFQSLFRILSELPRVIRGEIKF